MSTDHNINSWTSRRLRALTRHRAAVAAFLVGIIGLGFIIAARSWPLLDKYPTLQGIVRDIGSVMLASVAIGVVWESIIRHSFLEETLAAVQLSENVRVSRLEHIYSDFDTEIDWRDLFHDATRFDLFIAYGLFVRHLLRPYLEGLAANPQSIVRIVLPNPDNPAVIAELARRFGRSSQEVISGIHEAAAEFDLIFGSTRGKYELHYANGAPVYTFYRFSSRILIAFYPNHPGRVKVPSLLVGEGGQLFAFFERDFHRLTTKQN